MDSFLFALGAVTPIILVVAVGYFLKRVGLMKPDFAKAANRLVFHAFLPVTLFLNVYNIEDLGSLDFGYIAYALLAIFVLFLIAIPVMCLVTKVPERRGPLVQVSFRSNYALVGIPLAGSLFGTEGVVAATLLSALSIPLYNVLAVISLSIFRQGAERPSVRGILLGILKNPLIISIGAGLCALGIHAILAGNGIDFRLSDVRPLFVAAQYLSDLSTPMALLVLGAQFEFSAVRALRREILAGTLARTVAAPLFGVGAAYLFFRGTFNGAHFAALVALFATPVAVSSLPMAQEMKNDAALAGQLVVWTTLFSSLSIFLCALLLRLAGVFA